MTKGKSARHVRAFSWEAFSQIQVEQLRLLTSHGKKENEMRIRVENGTRGASIIPAKAQEHPAKMTEKKKPIPPPARETDEMPLRGLCFIIVKGGKRIEWEESDEPIATVDRSRA